jgi:two-component system CheB/CheR fusion protein
MLQPTLGRVRVLVVDDNADTAESTAVLLRLAFHCEARTCCDGPSCIEIAKRFRPHLLLLDLSMPNMDGFKIVEAMHEAGMAPPFIVAVSGYGGDVIREKCAQVGFSGHELKPMTIERLGELVECAVLVAEEYP